MGWVGTSMMRWGEVGRDEYRVRCSGVGGDE